MIRNTRYNIKKPEVMFQMFLKVKPSSTQMSSRTKSHTTPKPMPSTLYTSNKMLGFFNIGTSYTQRYFPSG